MILYGKPTVININSFKMDYPLNKKIAIEKGLDSKSSLLDTSLIYEPYLTTWANIYFRNSLVKYTESEQFIYTTEFTIRYNSRSKFINNRYRIIYNDQKYRIIEVIEIEPRQAIKILAEHYYGE